MWNLEGIDKKDLLTPASILVGSILVSLSVYLSLAAPSGTKSLAAVGAENLQNPTQPGAAQPVDLKERVGAASIGSGQIEMVEFSDFQCPYCQRFYQETYKELKAKYIDTGKVKFTFRHYPLPFHASAQKAAEASECAGSQGKFFEYHDVLFEKAQGDGSGLSVPELKQYAALLGLNTARFNACLDGGEMAATVKEDLQEAQRIGVSGTPSFVINGEMVVGARPLSSFEAIIEKALE